MKILTLNIQQGGGARSIGLINWLNESKPDVAILTEFRSGVTGETITSGLHEQGLSHLALTDAPRGTSSVLVASRFPITPKSVGTIPEDSHRLVAAAVEGACLFGVYFAQKNRKISLYETLTEMSCELLGQDSLIMGDFNTGIGKQDGTSKPFYAEEKFTGLLDLGWIDAWRARNPEAVEYSWYSTKSNGFRIDHVLASPSLNERIAQVSYDHTVREAGLSDHSALSVKIETGSSPDND